MELRRTHQHAPLRKIWLFPGVCVTCSSHLACRRFWISRTCCTTLVSRSVSSPPPVKPACYLPGSACDWEVPEQSSGKDTTSWQNTGTYYSHNSIKCTVSTEQEKRKLISSSLNSFYDNQCVTHTKRNYAFQRAIQLSKQITHLKIYPLSDRLAAGLSFRESRILVYKETNVPKLAITLVLAQHRRFYLPTCKLDCSKTQNVDVTASSCLASIQWCDDDSHLSPATHP